MEIQLRARTGEGIELFKIDLIVWKCFFQFVDMALHDCLK